MGVDSGVYKFLLFLHLMAVIVGFGPWMLATAFDVKARARPGREGLAIAETTYDVIRTYAEWAVYAVPILGILLVLTSDDTWKFSQAWISTAFLLYIVLLAVAHAVHFKNLKRINELMAELAGRPAGGPGGPPAQVAELEQRTRQSAMVGGILNLIVAVIVLLMVFKPGM